MDKENTGSPPPWRSARYGFAFLALGASTFSYLLTINFSVAIVCMTIDNDTAAVNSSLPMGRDEPAGYFAAYYEGLDLDTDVCPEPCLEIPDEETGEFYWNREMRGWLVSAFFFGYILTQIPGGFLSQRFGGKAVIGVAMIIATIATLLSPTAAWMSPYALFAMRFFNGFGQGVIFPSLYSMSGMWCPLYERSILIAIWISGVSIGSMISFGLSGVVCAELGWQWIFWGYGTGMGLYTIVWFVFVYNSPAEHPRITEGERKYIENCLQTTNTQSFSIPWRGLLTSPKVWCLVVYDFCVFWAMFMSLTQLPQYMKDVLKFDIEKNGLYNALPQVMRFIGGMLFAVLGDVLVNKGVCRVVVARKAIHSIATLVPIIFVIAIGHLDAEHAPMAIGFLVTQEFMASAVTGGANPARVDIAPQFAGIINGMCNTAANLPGIIVPIVVSSITQDGTREQWQNAFLIAGGFYFLGWLSFFTFGSAELQDWAKTPEQLALEVDAEKGEDNPGLEVSAEGRRPPTYSECLEEIEPEEDTTTHL